MSAPTNPFAAALEGHKEEGQQAATHSPHNPFAAHAPPATNPFVPPSGSEGYSQPAPQAPPAAQHESASHISQQLSGLDFGGTDSTTSASQQPAQSIGTHAEAAPQLAAPVETATTASATTPSQFSSGEPEMTTTYAPPPGPPPGHYGGSAAFPGNPSQMPPSSNLSQAEADEAYARQLLAEDEERVRRRQERRQARQGSNGAYQQQNFGGGRAAPALANGALAPGTPEPRPRDPNEEQQWNTKEIYWRGRIQRIIVQSENGPCSLIALCNVLLLRGTLTITPEDRPAVSYSYLSSLLGEHLIDVISTSQTDDSMDLEAALSILPQTQTGLDVNVCFSSIFGFSVDQAPTTQASTTLVDIAGEGSASSTAAAAGLPNAEKQKQRGELALFKLCDVPLVHGWLADEDDKDTWAAVVQRAGDYDKALDRVVAGDELAKGTIVEGGGVANGSSVDATRGLQPSEAVVVNDALLIRNFLENTATQLTYPGLYALSTQLERGTPYALFRNSHLSVLYRPSEEELRQAGDATQDPTDAAQPQLYQLVTDSTLEGEDTIVWESVEDVDGSASRFYDAKFRQSHAQDFVGRRDAGQGGGQVDEDADFAFAQQLQDQESRRARRSERSGRLPAHSGRTQAGNNGTTASDSPGGGNIISRMLAARKTGKRAPSSNARLESSLADGMGGRSSSQPRPVQYSMAQLPSDGPAPAEEYSAKKDKWYKKIF